MSEIKSILTAQYSLVKESREVLLQYCGRIVPADFVRSSSDVGNGGSIRNLLVHICNSYFGWMLRFAFEEPFEKIVFESAANLDHCAQHFAATDALVAR